MLQGGVNENERVIAAVTGVPKLPASIENITRLPHHQRPFLPHRQNNEPVENVDNFRQFWWGPLR